MSVQCYAQRLLNPFRGVVHTIQYASAEAVTSDGVHWDIYVSNDALAHDLGDARHVQTSDIRYGKWSADKGLKRGPINPSEDFRRLEEMGAVVYGHLLKVHGQVPFPLRDRYELWLLDAGGLPLALLHSAVSEQALDLDLPTDWRAGYAACERFSSPALPGPYGTPNAGEYLTRYINARAGTPAAAQWFSREPDGSGVGLAGIGPARGRAGRTLQAPEFPAFFLSERGHDELHRHLIDDYHAWLAPCLLLLGGLAPAVRSRLERQARRQALEMSRHHRLYPEIVDAAGLKAALVEAMLLRSQGAAEGETDDALSTFYLELSPAGNE
jgi:hypothetical protein